MTEFDWKNYLKQHHVFSDLDDAEIANLLTKGISREKYYERNQTILSEGDPGDSIYLIGQGEVEVYLKVSDSQDVVLNSLGEGDIVGEMAMFEQKPRSATAIAKMPCVMLEFDCLSFAQLLKVHPEIGFRLLVKLSERLRNLGNNVLNDKLIDVEQKIQHVNNKLDTEIKVIDASLKASQTVFDQTSKRATEVISSAERRSRHFTIAGSVLGTLFTVILGVLSFTGFNVKNNFVDQVEALEVSRDKVNDLVSELEASRGTINVLEGQIKSLAKMEQDMRKEIFPRLGYALVSEFRTEVSTDSEKALNTYESILSFKDDEISNDLYRQIFAEIFISDQKTRNHYAKVLQEKLKDRDKPLTTEQKILPYYILLSTYALNDDDSAYNNYLDTFKVMVKDMKSIKDVDLVDDFGAASIEVAISLGSNDNEEKQAAQIAKITRVWDMIK